MDTLDFVHAAAAVAADAFDTDMVMDMYKWRISNP